MAWCGSEAQTECVTYRFNGSLRQLAGDVSAVTLQFLQDQRHVLVVHQLHQDLYFAEFDVRRLRESAEEAFVMAAVCCWLTSEDLLDVAERREAHFPCCSTAGGEQGALSARESISLHCGVGGG